MSQQAYRQWVQGVIKGNEGVFWHEKQRGEVMWAAGLGQAKTCTWDDERPHWFLTDYMGTDVRSVTFDALYNDQTTIPYKAANMQSLPSLSLDHDVSRYATTTEQDYQHRVRDIKEQALAGNLWVMNLCHILRGDLPDEQSLLRVFDRFLDEGYDHMGGVVWTKEVKIICLSPELFLTHNHTNIETFPIKGTGTKAYLHASEKEVSELAMVTDLLRNDIGQICTKVDVPSPRSLRSVGSFYHAYAHIHGTLPSDDLTQSSYEKLLPVGSITGAPKHKVCQLIADMEAASRGWYTGTFGYKPNAVTTRSAVLIRTLVADGGTWYYGTGAGITHESNPETEWNETLQKAEILLRCSG